MKLGTTARNGACDGVVDKIDIGGGGKIEIYTGAPPADPQSSPTGTKLATLLFSNPAFGNATGGAASANAIASDVSADATGTAGWFRISDAAGVGIIDGTVTATGGGGDITFNTVLFVAGGLVSISSLVVAEAES